MAAAGGGRGGGSRGGAAASRSALAARTARPESASATRSPNGPVAEATRGAEAHSGSEGAGLVTVGAVRALHRRAGNAAVGRLIRDSLAGSSPIDATTTAATGPLISGHGPAPLPSAVQAELGRAGRPLDSGLRATMEHRFGTDFSGVRIHDDDSAAGSARAVQAGAYTVGDRVVFGAHRYDPASPEGLRLIAHELAHVVQQRRGGPAAISPHRNSALESAADRAADAYAEGQGTIDVAGSSTIGLSLAPEDDKKHPASTKDRDAYMRLRQLEEQADARSRDMQAAQVKVDVDRRMKTFDAKNPGATPKERRAAREALRKMADSNVTAGYGYKMDADNRVRGVASSSDALADRHKHGPGPSPAEIRQRDRAGVTHKDAAGNYESDWARRAPRPVPDPKDAQPKAATKAAGGSSHGAPTTPHQRTADDAYAHAEANVVSASQHAAEHERLLTVGASRATCPFCGQRIGRSGATAATVTRDGVAAGHDPQISRNVGHLADEKDRPAAVVPTIEYGRTNEPSHTIASSSYDPKRRRKPRKSSSTTAASSGPNESPSARGKGATQPTGGGDTATQARRSSAPTKPNARSSSRADRGLEGRDDSGSTIAVKPGKPRARKQAAGDGDLTVKRAAKPKAGRTKATPVGKPADTTPLDAPHAALRTPKADRRAGKPKADTVTKPKANKVTKPKADKPKADKPKATGPKAGAGKVGGPGTVASAATTPQAGGGGHAPAAVQHGTSSGASGPGAKSGGSGSGAGPSAKPVATTGASSPLAAKPADPKTVAAKPLVAATATPSVKPSVKGAGTPPTHPQQGHDSGQGQTPGHAPRHDPDHQDGEHGGTGHDGAPITRPKIPMASTNINTKIKGGLTSDASGVGASGSASADRTHEHPNGVTTTQSIGASGSFKVLVVPVTGTSQFDVILTITLGAHVSLGGSVGQGKSVSAQLGANGSVTGTFSHRFTTNEDAAHYVAALKSGSGGSGTEMQILELARRGSLADAQKLLTLAQQGKMTAKGAHDLGEGESISLEEQKGADAGAGGSFGNVGAQVSFSKSRSLKRTITRHDGKTIVTVEVVSDTGGSVGASGSIGVVGGGATYGKVNTVGRSVSFRFDAGHDADIDEVLAIDTPEQLDTMAGHRHRDVVSDTHHTATSDDLTVHVNVAGAEGSIGDTSGLGRSVRRDESGVTTDYSGSHGGHLALGLHDGPKMQYGHSSAVNTSVGPDHRATGDLATTDQNTDVAALAHGVVGLVSDPKNAAANAVAGHPPVTALQTEVIGMKLSDNDFSTIAATAAADDSGRAWDKAFAGRENQSRMAWRRLRHRIARAHGDRDAISVALTEYAHENDEAATAVSHVVRPEGTTAGGVRYDFPSGMESEQNTYNTLVVGDPVGDARSVAGSGKPDEAIASLTSANQQLTDLSAAILKDPHRFTDSAAVVEMGRLIAARQRDIRAAIPELKSATPARTGTDVGAEAVDIAKAVTRTDAGPTNDPAKDDAAQAEHDKEEAHARHQTDAAALIPLFQAAKRAENEEFAAIDKELHDPGFFSVPDVKLIFTKLNALTTKYGQWDLQVADLKKILTEDGKDPAFADQYGPNRARWKQLRYDPELTKY